MTRRILPLVFLLGAWVPVWAQGPPAPSSPAAKRTEIKVETGTIASVEAAVSAAGKVQWCWNSDELHVKQVVRDSAGQKLYVTSGRPATYTVVAFTADSVQEFRVTFVGTVPPGPDPPKPPVPDQLLQSLQAAFAADIGTPENKVANKQLLAELLRQMALTDTRDPTIKTAEQLRLKVTAAAKRLMQDALSRTRLACWQEIIKVLPAETTSLDGKRDQVAAVFLSLAETLGKVQ